LISHLVVVAVFAVTVSATVGFVAPNAFDMAMGPSMSGMGSMMGGLVETAFNDAVNSALLIAVPAAVIAAVAISVALSARISGPIANLAAASRRIADGRYAERVPAGPSDEIGELAASFNQMAASLESTERRRLQLVGDVAHELRTPLTTLEGFLEGLEDDVIAPSAATWKLLRDETARLSRLVNELQELWRAEAHQLPLSPAILDMAEELRAVRDRFATQAMEHEISLTLDLPPARVTVEADHDRVAQILNNFTSNAIRYSPDGRTVRLTLEVDRDEVVVGVSDQGPGLSEDERERVFERFYRVDPSRSRALGGSGIGLAIARALAEAMGGRAWAESAGAGLGSTFLVALPRAD
jgi:histidine kinase